MESRLGRPEVFGDANSVESGSTLLADVVVAGAGAAGIAIARELRGSGLRVVVLESGGFDYDPATQDLYRGTVSGSPYALEASRLRYFGGTTNHWGGWVRPLDDADFEGRPWVPRTGWPLSRADLDPYYGPAFDVTSQLDRHPFDWEAWRTGDFDVEALVESENLTGAMYRIVPLRFNEVYRSDLADASDVTVYLGANVVNIATDPSATSVTAFDVRTLGGNAFAVSAARYVIALGGIDNARLLLASSDVEPAGIGNSNDLVGRYFMDHIEAQVATLVLSDPAPGAYLGGRFDLARAALVPTEAAAQAHDLAGTAFLLGELPPAGHDDAPTGSLRPPVLEGVLGSIERSDPRSYSLELRAEPEPNPDSRVTLNEETDALGMPTVDVHRVLTDADHQRLRRAVEFFASELGALGIGWTRIDAGGLGTDDSSLFYGFHHMGTTRMSEDPTTGVVAPDGRVHGVENLWVAGSSVFPSVGYANPTLTIVALALRMADSFR